MKIIALIFSILLFSATWSDNAMLLEDEKNTIQIFRDSVKSVVNVTSNIKLSRSFYFDFQTEEVPAGTGSGFIWDGLGHVVTNFHVVADAAKSGGSYLITFHQDNKQYKAKLVGAEPRYDIAVLKLEEKVEKLHPIKVGSSKELMVGQKTIAIGNPFGLDHTITTGIVSALGRKIDGIGGVKIHGMIQTDASINPGNSGGPLLSSQGLLIGMNTMIFSKSGTSAGVGFAIPSDIINQTVPQLIEHGKIIRPGLGISLLDDHYRDHFGLEKGIIIRDVDPAGPAAKAGLKGMAQGHYGRVRIGDIILKIDDKEVNNYNDIFHVLDNYKVGDTVQITYLRDGKVQSVKLTLTEI